MRSKLSKSGLSPGSRRTVRYFSLLIVIVTTIVFVGACGSDGETVFPSKRESYFEVTRFMDTPGRGTEDIVYHKGFLWVTDSDKGGTIYCISPANGDILAKNQPTFGLPGSIINFGDVLIVTEKFGGELYVISADERMEIITSYDTGLSEIRGLFRISGVLYAYDYAERAVYEFDDDFATVSVRYLNEGVRDLKGFRVVNGQLWSAEYKYGRLNTHNDSNLHIENEYVTLCPHPAGITWDGANMYLGDPAGRKIYVLDISTQ